MISMMEATYRRIGRLEVKHMRARLVYLRPKRDRDFLRHCLIDCVPTFVGFVASAQTSLSAYLQ